MDLWSVLYLVAGAVGATGSMLAVRWARRRFADPHSTLSASRPSDGPTASEAADARAEVHAAADAGRAEVRARAESDRERARRAMGGES